MPISTAAGVSKRPASHWTCNDITHSLLAQIPQLHTSRDFQRIGAGPRTQLTHLHIGFAMPYPTSSVSSFFPTDAAMRRASPEVRLVLTELREFKTELREFKKEIMEELKKLEEKIDRSACSWYVKACPQGRCSC